MLGRGKICLSASVAILCQIIPSFVDYCVKNHPSWTEEEKKNGMERKEKTTFAG